MALNTTPGVFENQIKTLIANNYTFLTAKDLGEIIDNKKPLPNNPILLTFDDGHRDFDTNVLPIIKKYNVKVTAYIITGFLGGSDFMTRSQIQEVANSNLVDIGAHTVHHIALKRKIYPVAKFEIDESKKFLQDNYHINVVSFAYPDGSFDQQAINLVKDDGFTTAVSTVLGINQGSQNRFFLYRLRPGMRSGATLLNYLQKL